MSGLGQDPGDVVFFCQVMSPHHPDQISRVQTRSLRRFSIILISFVFDIDILSKYLKIEFSIIFISASMPLFFCNWSTNFKISAPRDIDFTNILLLWNERKHHIIFGGGLEMSSSFYNQVAITALGGLWVVDRAAKCHSIKQTQDFGHLFIIAACHLFELVCWLYVKWTRLGQLCWFGSKPWLCATLRSCARMWEPSNCTGLQREISWSPCRNCTIDYLHRSGENLQRHL